MIIESETAGPRQAHRSEIVANWLALGVLALLALTVAADLHGPLRVLLAFVTCSTVPGWAVTSRLPVDDLTARFGLSIGLSLAIVSGIGMATLWMSIWQPLLISFLEGVGCVILIATDLKRLYRRGSGR